MRGSRKTVAAAGLVLAIAAGGCGGSGDSNSTTSAVHTQRQAGQSQARANRAQSERSNPQQTNRRGPRGGGAAEFRVPGGDNSIQEFGAEASRSELERAGAALHGFLDARAAGEWSKACAHLTKSTIASFEQLAARSKQGPEGCGAVMKALSGGVPKSSLEEAAQADVGALRTEGGRAFLLYRGARGTDYAISMAKEDGVWKVGALAGVPLS